VARETGSSGLAAKFIAQAAINSVTAGTFSKYETNIIDDHNSLFKLEFRQWTCRCRVWRMGIRFDAMGEFHHSNADTMDKVPQHS